MPPARLATARSTAFWTPRPYVLVRSESLARRTRRVDLTRSNPNPRKAKGMRLRHSYAAFFVLCTSQIARGQSCETPLTVSATYCAATYCAAHPSSFPETYCAAHSSSSPQNPPGRCTVPVAPVLLGLAHDNRCAARYLGGAGSNRRPVAGLLCAPSRVAERISQFRCCDPAGMSRVVLSSLRARTAQVERSSTRSLAPACRSTLARIRTPTNCEGPNASCPNERLTTPRPGPCAARHRQLC